MRKNPNFVLREIYGKNILMPVRYNEASNDPVCFNEVAATIWKTVNNLKNEDELLSSVCQIYNLKKDSAEAAAVNSFIKELINIKL